MESQAGWGTATVDSLREVDATRWDELAGANVLASYGWLRATEDGVVAQLMPGYVLLHLDGALAGAAVCYLCPPDNHHFAPDGFLFGRFRHLAVRLNLTRQPVLVCCPYHCYGTHLMVDPRLQGTLRSEALGQLLRGVEALARAARVPTWLPRVQNDEEEIVTRLAERGFHRTHMFSATYIDIEWDSFAGYLAHVRGVSKKAAQNVRTEISRNERAGVVIAEIHDVRSHAAALHALANQHHLRHNRWPVPYSPEFFPRLKENLGGDFVVYGAFKNDALVGFSAMLQRGGVAHVLFVGVDHERTPGEFTYFNVAFYRPIADAIASGFKRVCFGMALQQVKRRRGARTVPLYLYYKGATPVRHVAMKPWLALHAAWMNRKLTPRRGGQRG
jgi:predicted N-acyltransferase